MVKFSICLNRRVFVMNAQLQTLIIDGKEYETTEEIREAGVGGAL